MKLGDHIEVHEPYGVDELVYTGTVVDIDLEKNVVSIEVDDIHVKLLSRYFNSINQDPTYWPVKLEWCVYGS